MYNLILILGVLFCIYIVFLVMFVLRRYREEARVLGINRNEIRGFTKERSNVIKDISLVDDGGKSVLRWRPLESENYIASKIYLRVSNNPVAAVARYELTRSDKAYETVVHDRNGSRFWYWVTLLYEDGSESEKQLIGVLPEIERLSE